MKTLWDYQKELEEAPQEEPVIQASSEERIEIERQDVLSHVASYSVNTLRDKVAWVLNNFPETRESDITLQLKFWELFESGIYSGRSIDPKDLYRLTRLTSLARERARIQNQYKLFLASQEVRQKRGTLSDEEKEKAASDKPSHPVFIVYLDESGKTGNFLLVGSIWFLSGGRMSMTLTSEIKALREASKFSGEFHFKEMKSDDLAVYKRLADIFVQHSQEVSFKLISLPRAGVGKSQDALAELFYHLLLKGVEHEDKTGRAPLPRGLQIWKDSEETGADKLLLANLEDRLKQASQSVYKDRLTIERLFAVDSEKNVFLQVADLLTSSANRLLSRTSEKRNHKDEFAEYLIDSLRIDPTFTPNDRLADGMVHIAL